MVEKLSFDAESHTYRYDGRVVPSVTQILEPLQFLNGIPWAVLDAAREFGTHVHLACHLHNLGVLDEETLDPPLRPYLAAWVKFLAETGFKVTDSECRVYSETFRYAGTADAFGEWRGTTWVVDIKSGVVPDTVGAQLIAYAEAAPVRPKRRLCVQLIASGDYKLHEQTDRSDWPTFVSALNIWNFRNKRNPAHVR